MKLSWADKFSEGTEAALPEGMLGMWLSEGCLGSGGDRAIGNSRSVRDAPGFLFCNLVLVSLDSRA